MAEKKITESGEKFLKYSFIASAAIMALLAANDIYNDRGGNILTGKKVKIDDDATVYTNLTDMINEENGKSAYYDSSYERLVISTFYQLDGNYIRVDMQGNYKEKEQQIIDNDGVLIGIITTVDFKNKTPEAFYKTNDFKRYQKVKKIKNKI